MESIVKKMANFNPLPRKEGDYNVKSVFFIC